MVSFWIDLDSVPARTSLGILTILTITTQSSGTGQGGPTVSLTKAIDVWMAACLVFVFGAFIEYSIVNVLARREVTRRKKLKQRRRQEELRQEELRQEREMKEVDTDVITSCHKPRCSARQYSHDRCLHVSTTFSRIIIFCILK